MNPKLVDSFGRVHTALRLSVTDRCNIRCFYCMPSEEIEFLPRPHLLTFEELTRVVRVFASLGIRKIRLTGGEPLVRRDIPVLIRALRQIGGIEEIAMTTNAILLADRAAALRNAGLDRLNISLDTLDRQQFQEITRRDELPATLNGIAAALAAGFDDIRLNAVAVKGLIESQIDSLVEFAIGHQLTLRFIEFMPLNSSGRWHEDDVLTGRKIRAIIEQRFGQLIPVPCEDLSQPASAFRTRDGTAQIGFINSVSEPFCGNCNRLRLTAEGKLRNCLFSHAEWDLRGPLREGAGDDELESIILGSVASKRAAHGMGDGDFRKPERAMYQIGG
jgi:cyclic pyranopterin phosphate synthase